MIPRNTSRALVIVSTAGFLCLLSAPTPIFLFLFLFFNVLGECFLKVIYEDEQNAIFNRLNEQHGLLTPNFFTL